MTQRASSVRNGPSDRQHYEACGLGRTRRAALLYHGNLLDLALAYAASGKAEEAEAIYDELLARSRREYVQPSWLALINAALGKKDDAFEWLDRAYDERDAILVCVKYFRGSDPLRDDPRFDALLKRLGFEE